MKLLDDLCGSSVRGIILSGGGEPTIYPHFKEVARKIAETRLKACLYTHGGHIGRHIGEIADAFVEVRISLDAASPLTHSSYHSGGDTSSFSNILRNMERLKDLNPEVRVGLSILLTDRSARELAGLDSIVREPFVDFLLLKFSRFPRDNEWVTPTKLQAIEERVSGMNKLASVYYRSPYAETSGSFPVLKCRTHFLKTLIAPDGTVNICNQRRGDETMVLGSLFTDDFWLIWNREHHNLVHNGIDTSKCPPCRHVAYNDIIEHVDLDDYPTVFGDGATRFMDFL